MDEKIIGKIVGEVFKKAKKEHASHSKFALSNHVSSETDLSARTLERAYDRYINHKGKYGVPQAESIDLFCRYLGYKDFRDYVKVNPVYNGSGEKKVNGIDKRKLIITVSVVFGLILLILGVQKKYLKNQLNASTEEKCMTWAESSYVEISCDLGPYSKEGNAVKPLNRMELRNMRKVKVNAAFKFFADDGKPLIWYYKNKDDKYEYFTAPGLHPITGETLRKITPYIIQKYVPMHSNKKESFLPE